MLSSDAKESSDEAAPESALLAAALIPSRSSFCSRSKTRCEVLKVLRRSSWGRRRSGWSYHGQVPEVSFAEGVGGEGSGGGLSLTSRRWFSAFSLVVDIDIDMMKPWCVEVKDVLDEEDVEYLVCM